MVYEGGKERLQAVEVRLGAFDPEKLNVDKNEAIVLREKVNRLRRNSELIVK